MQKNWALAPLVAIFLITSTNLSGEPNRISAGVNYVGGQIRYDLDENDSVELRYLTGQDDAPDGNISSQVFGFRGYRFLGRSNTHQFFIGPELAFINSIQTGTPYKASGPALGGFAGIQYGRKKKWALGFDIGPYLLLLEETTQSVPETSLEFIANTYFIFYVF